MKRRINKTLEECIRNGRIDHLKLKSAVKYPQNIFSDEYICPSFISDYIEHLEIIHKACPILIIFGFFVGLIVGISIMASMIR